MLLLLFVGSMLRTFVWFLLQIVLCQELALLLIYMKVKHDGKKKKLHDEIVQTSHTHTTTHKIKHTHTNICVHTQMC